MKLEDATSHGLDSMYYERTNYDICIATQVPLIFPKKYSLSLLLIH